MTRATMLQRWWARCLMVFIIWTILGLVDASQTYFLQSSRGIEMPLWAALLLGVSDWYIWALLTPLIVWLARRFPLEQLTWNRLLFHALASVGSALLVILLAVPILRTIPYALSRPIDNMELFQLVLASKLVFYILTHWLILGAAHGLLYYNQLQERELRTSRLETQLAQAQLQMLKMQLHPHFLFNTLHAISALIRKDGELADRMIARLGDLLRTTLESAGTQEVSLQQELEFIQPYLDIEQARLGSRLRVQMNIDPAVLDGLVPNLLLQPLVENAIRHGVVPQPEGGLIEVRACRQEEQLHLQISDTGPGVTRPLESLKEGVGLSNTRARLHRLYGDQHTFRLQNGPSGGCVVLVVLPFREIGVAERKEECQESKYHSRNAEINIKPNLDVSHVAD